MAEAATAAKPSPIVERVFAVDEGEDVQVATTGNEWQSPMTVDEVNETVWEAATGDEWRTRELTLASARSTYAVAATDCDDTAPYLDAGSYEQRLKTFKPSSETKPWPYETVDESDLPARVGLPDLLEAVEEEGPEAFCSYVAANLGISEPEVRGVLQDLDLRPDDSSKLRPDPALTEQIEEIRAEVRE